MSAELTIYSETRQSFEITVDGRTFILKQNGGSWELSNAVTGFWRNLGRAKRWQTALDNAATMLLDMVDD